MTVRQLKEALEQMEKDGYAEAVVTVHTFGVLAGGNAEVKNANVGFDWTSGQVVLQTATPLTRHERKRRSR